MHCKAGGRPHTLMGGIHMLDIKHRSGRCSLDYSLARTLARFSSLFCATRSTEKQTPTAPFSLSLIQIWRLENSFQKTSIVNHFREPFFFFCQKRLRLARASICARHWFLWANGVCWVMNARCAWCCWLISHEFIGFVIILFTNQLVNQSIDKFII